MMYFLKSMDTHDMHDRSEGTYSSCGLEEVQVLTYLDDNVFAINESYPTFGLVSEVENPSLCFRDIKHLKLKEL